MSYVPYIIRQTVTSCRIAAAAALFTGNVAFAQSPLYVDVNATGPVHDGTSWCSAYMFLQDALAEAEASGGVVTEIRVADGVYKPDQGANQTPGDREASLQLLNGVALRGGYAGCGAPDPDDRDIALYETILSGDLAGDDAAVSCTQDYPDCFSFGKRCIDGSCIIKANNGENAEHVVMASGVDETAVLDGFTITGGNADYPTSDRFRGGGMFIDAGANPTIANCTFSGNSAACLGGGMSIDGGSPMLSNCEFSRNSATGDYGGSGGGGLYTRYGNPTLMNCTFSGNWAGNGGGLRNYQGEPTLTNCTFSGNSSGDDHSNGGGMSNDGGNPTLTNCIFTGNSAGDGGGMGNEDGSPTLTNCAFSGNSADYGGGGLSNHEGSPTLTDCTFSGNSTDNNGGGMYNRSAGGDTTLANCTFSGNSANRFGGGMSNDWGELLLTNCTFSANSADYGGGMSNDGDATLDDCTFSGNSAGNDGGGMHNDWGELLLTNCTFSGNSAVRYGGGMYNYYGDPTVTNSTFSGNSAVRYGGGMYSFFGDPTVTNSTFSGNSAGEGAGGVFTYRGSPTVTNCILWGNTRAGGVCDQNAQISSIDGVTYSCIQGWDGYGTGNIGDDPRFVDPLGPDGIPGTEDDDLRLSRGSPCIDAGDNTAVPVDVVTDLDGKPRFVNDPLVLDTGYGMRPIVDMGAYERQVVLLDIHPGRCPNWLNVMSNARVRVAVVGTDAFDVTQIDTDSLVLERADGLGGSLTSWDRRRGNAISVTDAATPFEGDLCDCHRLRRDGIDDLVLSFSTRDIVEELDLRGIGPRTPMILTLRGLLLDGTPFDASDCILTFGGRPTVPSRSLYRDGKD